jgi:enamine deaminase RidA (YjgF/YER057c/UK114 family)
VGDRPPARSTVEVAKLPSGALVEIEAIAFTASTGRP